MMQQTCLRGQQQLQQQQQQRQRLASGSAARSAPLAPRPGVAAPSQPSRAVQARAARGQHHRQQQQQRSEILALPLAHTPSPQQQPQQQAQQHQPRDVAARAAAVLAVADVDVDAPAQQQQQQQQQQPLKRYVVGELLGTGTVARVHACTDTWTGEQLAIKVMPRRSKAGRDRTLQLRSEVEVARRVVGCRHVAAVVDAFEDERNVYVVQQLCSGGDVADLMAAQGGRLTEREAAAVMVRVLEFLEDLHASGVCYGDVKPNNFALRGLYPSIAHLLDPSRPRGLLDVLALDFGCCQAMRPGGLPSEYRVTGTPLYMAPESLCGRHGLEVDVWAAGVMLFQLLSDRFPFFDVDVHELQGLGAATIRDGILHGPVIFGADPWSTPGAVHRSAQDLVLRMLQRDPAKRMTAAEALRHPWFFEALGA